MIDDERGESDQERRMEQETNAKVIFEKRRKRMEQETDGSTETANNHWEVGWLFLTLMSSPAPFISALAFWLNQYPPTFPMS